MRWLLFIGLFCAAVGVIYFASANTEGVNKWLAAESTPILTLTPEEAVTAVAANSNIVVRGAQEDRTGFYGLIAECGGPDSLQDAIVETYVGARIVEQQDKYTAELARKDYTNVSAALVKRGRGWVVEYKATHPTAGAIEEEQQVVLHLRERVEWLPTPTPAPQATPTPLRDGFGLGGPFDPTPTAEPTATPAPPPTPARAAASITWEIKLGTGALAPTLIDGVLGSDCVAISSTNEG